MTFQPAVIGEVSLGVLYEQLDRAHYFTVSTGLLAVFLAEYLLKAREYLLVVESRREADAEVVGHRPADPVKRFHRPYLDLILTLAEHARDNLALHVDCLSLPELGVGVFVVPAEEGELMLAREVLYLDAAEGLALLGHPLFGVDHEATHPQFHPRLLVLVEIGHPGVAVEFQDHIIRVERVGREVDCHHLLLLFQKLNQRPFVIFREGRFVGFYVVFKVVEEAGLKRVLVVLDALAILDEQVGPRAVEHRFDKHLAVYVEAVERAGQGQGLDGVAVAGREVHPLHKVINVLVGAVLLPLGEDGVHGVDADTLDRAESETDLARRGDAELLKTLVDVRVLDGYPHPLALGHDDLQLV